MGMSIDTVNQWLKIQRQNLKDFPEIASDKKIESLDTAISYLEDYKQLLHKYLKDIKKALENGIDTLPSVTQQEPRCKEAQEYYTVEATIKAHVKATCKEEAEIILHNCISIFPEEEYCDSIKTKIVSVEKDNKK